MARSVRHPSLVRILGALLIATTALACGGANPGSSTGSRNDGAPPQTTAAGGGGPSIGQGSSSAGLCGLFTPAELGPFLGGQPAPGSIGGPMESLCQWEAGEVDLMIQKAPEDYFEDYRGANGYEEIDGIGEYAYSAPHAFGRITAARTAEAAYIVIASEGTDQAGQVEILQTFVERSPGAPDLAAP